jgi:hypothetical protein
VAINICPACGYPTIGPEPCAVCRSIGALTGDKTFESMLSANEAAPRIGTGISVGERTMNRSRGGGAVMPLP